MKQSDRATGAMHTSLPFWDKGNDLQQCLFAMSYIGVTHGLVAILAEGDHALQQHFFTICPEP